MRRRSGRSSAGLARRRRPVPRRRPWRRIALAGASVLILGGGIWWALTSPVFAVAAITTTPCRYVPRDTLAALARPWLGRNLWLCRPERLAAAVRRFPWVAGASVHRRPPRTLAVRVREHRPLLLLGEPAPGDSWRVLLENGDVARLAPAVPPPDLPLLAPPAGAEAVTSLSDSLRADLARLCRAVAMVGLEAGASRVDFVRIAPEGYRLLLSGPPRRELRLGRDRFAEALRRYLAVRDRLDPGGSVDLRFHNQVTRRPLVLPEPAREGKGP